MHTHLTVKAGDTFDTPFESGCKALSDPDEYGGVDGLDSEGVRCLFHVSMITAVTVTVKREEA